MKFAIALFSPPHSPASRRALRFTEAALQNGHEIVRIFFYQEGVHSASGNIAAPQDELNLSDAWRALVTEYALDATVCIAAALRRGVLNEQESQRYGRGCANLEAPWALAGLGQLHDGIQQADRLICFGGH